MQHSDSSRQRIVRGSVLALRLLANFASTAYAGPNNPLTAELGMSRSHSSLSMPKAQHYRAPANAGGAARDAGYWRYGDERDFENFLRDE
jgi:hypothetical protein